MKKKRRNVGMKCLAVLLVMAMLCTVQGITALAMLGEENVETKMEFDETDNYVTNVFLNGGHSAAITANGDLYCWGNNSYGQVGNGKNENQTSPVHILCNVTTFEWGALDDNLSYCAAITENGDLYCWGRNDHGQVGNGSTEDQYTPVKVLRDVISVNLTMGCSAAITKNGDLYCWGSNWFGEVGNGGNDAEEDFLQRQFTPVKVLSNVDSAYLGEYLSTAITTNGDLYCWGRNEDGEVGNGSEEEKQYVPVKVMLYHFS